VNHKDSRAAPSRSSQRNADLEHDTACSSFSLEDWETWFVESGTDSDNDDINFSQVSHITYYNNNVMNIHVYHRNLLL
jgi:hypothetical protein